jgi:hypothetical protein
MLCRQDAAKTQSEGDEKSSCLACFFLQFAFSELVWASWRLGFLHPSSGDGGLRFTGM